MKRSISPKIIFRHDSPSIVTWGLQKTPTGMLMIGITPARAICRIGFARDGKVSSILKKWKKEWPDTNFVRAEKEVASVVQKMSEKTLPTLYMTGTAFQHKVWKGMITIPAGKTLSYAALARKIKKPKAARAVGAACGANPVPLLVPCHRVIASNGGLGGFSGGLAIKKALLKAENYDRA